MSTPSMVPMVAPDGTVGHIPSDRVNEAISNGGQLGVRMQAPDGSTGIIPRTNVVTAIRNGGKVLEDAAATPTSSLEQPKQGFLKTLGAGLKSMVTPGDSPIMTERSNMPLFGDVQRKQAMGPQAAADEASRKQAGYGQPYRTIAGLGQTMGINASGMEQAAAQGDTGAVMGHATAAAAPIVAGEVAGRTLPWLTKNAAEFARAPSDPNAVYNSYLRPVANSPMSTPGAPEPVLRAVFRDMEAAGEGEAANRIINGQSTIGDLDLMRQRANRLSRSIYRSPGNYPPGMAEGADTLASSIRDRIYPAIENAQGLPEGSLRGIKDLQGQMMESQRTPTMTNRLVTKAAGAVPGAVIGYRMGGPGGAMVGGMIGESVAEPLAAAADRGMIGLRTKARASKLPEPGLVPRKGLPFPRTMPEGESTPPMANAPAWSPTTRAQRLGFLLPEETGGPIELPYVPEMTPGEQVSAFMNMLRGKAPKSLAARGRAIQLPASSQK